MRSLYALHLSLSVAIPGTQPCLRLSGTNRLRSAFHGGQRRILRLIRLNEQVEGFFCIRPCLSLLDAMQCLFSFRLI
ncbi:MAG: hypothetical protein KZQ66_13045 [Candidatus Thiodiazotropha sp. (ex Lucinoma aequizonata)]|nr:hypothetical protein [Candidatus Thiodiazotropha sp. (ex Lucinoma aequizonata)]MCU7899180.1 hypothetical protein [Candidatus Thiodiazotropha sp. (ex Lucinoma aequizonata)]MCU7902807.1 hypothetical protein [Candidatus Thiodiazotropha sp. (ex Lucinoma aequizonata)]MCU7910123.1 hypothetical protein [Candidatus Thiodiazotropha sp. (ex Lucinoma aequizonata)]MCU7911303.1 hypothetical protein [Candidatus Thiodiazotropha sp. (ex Lucinoma aequizonata)]